MRTKGEIMAKERKMQRDGQKGSLPFLLVFFVLSIVCAVLGVLCLSQIQVGWARRNYLLLCVLYGALICLSFILFTIFILRGKKTATRLFLGGVILLTTCLLIIYILQKTGFFAVVNSADNLREYLQSAGLWMPAFYTLLQFLQVIVLPIPGIVSTAVGVNLFGAFKTLLLSFFGIFLGSVVAFFIGRKWGYKAVAWMVGEETLTNWQTKLKGKDYTLLTLMFLLPLFPDDILCFLAGLSSMSNKFFLIMIAVTRFISILATCYFVNFIPFTTWWGLLVWGILFAVVIVLFVFLPKKMDKIHAFLRKIARRSNPKDKGRDR